jgi:transposase
MSLHPQTIAPVPADTARVAQAAFPQGNTYMLLRDEIGAIYEDVTFASLFPKRGQPAETPWRLALVSIMQYAEGLSDRQAAAAVRSRIDWKYALSLELTDPGFDSTVLSEFRTRLVTGGAEQQLLERFLEICRERQLLRSRGRQRTDSTHVLAAVRVLNRLECIGETMRHALNTLALVAPDWLREHSQTDWIERYGPRVEEYRLPSGQAKRQACAELMGADGLRLLQAIFAADAPLWLRQIPSVELLRQVWTQQFYREAETLHWRTEKLGLPPSACSISSPYDVEAHHARKRSTAWMGYKVHLSETCDQDSPHLITHVETTIAPVVDGDCTAIIHAALQKKDLLPGVHLVDSGYVSAQWLLNSQRDYGVNLLGPTRSDYLWQARAAAGFAASDFVVNWQRQQVTCPQGRTSHSWTSYLNKHQNEVIKIQFSQHTCGQCVSRTQCTRGRRRSLQVQPQVHQQALQVARKRESTVDYADQYRKRAGIEGTISQGVRAFGLRRARYIGLAKTHLQHILTATAINFVRLSHWLQDKPLARTRQSSFTRLMTVASA